MGGEGWRRSSLQRAQTRSKNVGKELRGFLTRLESLIFKHVQHISSLLHLLALNPS
jgi:hypothetical protein